MDESNIGGFLKSHWIWLAAAGGGLLLLLWLRSRSSSGSTVVPAANSGGSTPSTLGNLSGSTGGSSVSLSDLYNAEQSNALALGSISQSIAGLVSGVQQLSSQQQSSQTNAGMPANIAPAGQPAQNLNGYEVTTSGVPYVTQAQFNWQTSQPLSPANIAAAGKGGPNDLTSLAQLNGGTGPNPSEQAYFDALNAAKKQQTTLPVAA